MVCSGIIFFQLVKLFAEQTNTSFQVVKNIVCHVLLC